MADVTVNESTYDRYKRDAEAYRKQMTTHRQEGEAAGVRAYKEGKKGEALMLVGGANAPALQAVIGGAAVYWLAGSDFTKDIQVFKDHWWLKPLLIIGLGYWLWRKGNPWAAAILSSGAALFVAAWQSRSEAKKDAKKEAAGPEEAGWWHDGEWREHEWRERPWWERDHYERGRWVETPSGGRAFIAEGPATRAAERMADRIFFEHAR
jgi:hypothetical protein